MQLTPYFVGMALAINIMSTVHAGTEPHEQHHEGHRHHGAHVHGMATLDLVADGNDVMIHLRSPLINFLGFEHQPATDQQESAYHDLHQQLQTLETLLTAQGAHCQAEDIEIADPFAGTEETLHADMDVSYFLHCDNTEDLAALQVNLFTHYAHLETIEVQMILPSGQQHIQLKPQQTVIRIN